MDAPKLEVPVILKFDMPVAPPVVYNLNVLVIFNVPMKSSFLAAVVTDENLKPTHEVRGTLHMSVIEMGCSLKWFTVSTQA